MTSRFANVKKRLNRKTTKKECLREQQGRSKSNVRNTNY